MKLSGLKYSLQGLFYLYLFSMLLAGCGGKGAATPFYAEVFSPEYYILKRADKGDYTKLQNFLSSSNEATKASAALILGYYYLRDGEVEKASPLIEGHSENSALSPYMKKMGELWQMELALAEKRYQDAERWAAKLDGVTKTAEERKAMDTYCVIMRLYPAGGEAFGCVVERLAKFRGGVTELAEFDNGSGVTQSASPDKGALYAGALEILVVSQADTQDVSGGIYFYNKTHALNHKIRLSRTFVDGNWDFVLDLDSGYLGGRGYGIFFKPDLSGPFENLPDYLDLRCGKTLIGAGAGLSGSAAVLEGELTAQGSVVKVVDIGGTEVTRAVRAALAEWDGQPFCAIGAGTEAEIDHFIPNVRQYVLNIAQQRIYIVKDVDTGKHLTKDYIQYYTGTRILPLMNLDMSSDMQEFGAEYEEFSGRKLTYEALLGYDMMHYVHSRTMEGASLSEPYLTNITGFENGRAERELRGFYITHKGTVEELTLHKPKKQPGGEEMNTQGR